MSGAIASTGRTDYCTPEWILKPVREFFGGQIDLDPCSNLNSTVGALMNVILSDPSNPTPPALPEGYMYGNGLTCDWRGLQSYINPPFGRKKGGTDIGAWIAKAWMTRESEPSSEIILCIPDTPDAQSWRKFILSHEGADGRCQIGRRVPFVGMKTGIPKPISLVYFGARALDFRSTFQHMGRVECPREAYAGQSHLTFSLLAGTYKRSSRKATDNV